MGMTGLPPGEFSLISPGTKIPGQVKFNINIGKNPGLSSENNNDISYLFVG
jgi:hypothetical protein